jgi:hypothetical protein
MNKQLTKKSIGIAASAALMASMAFSGNVLAGPPEGKGPPPAQDQACDLSPEFLPVEENHTCVVTLRGVNAAIMGAESLNDRDESTLLNKVCEAHYKFLADKLYDAAQKLTDISMTIESKRKVDPADQDSISDAADAAAEKVLVSCQSAY